MRTQLTSTGRFILLMYKRRLYFSRVRNTSNRTKPGSKSTAFTAVVHFPQFFLQFHSILLRNRYSLVTMSSHTAPQSENRLCCQGHGILFLRNIRNTTLFEVNEMCYIVILSYTCISGTIWPLTLNTRIKHKTLLT